MNEPEAGEDPLVPEGQASAPAIRFCRQCGALLHALTGECVTCLAGPSRASTTPSEKHARRPAIGSALSLYFALLATSLLAYVAISGEVLADLVTEAVDSVLVLAWAAAAWQTVRHGLKSLPSGRSVLLAIGLGGLSFAVASVLVSVLSRGLGFEQIRYVQPFLDEGCGLGVVFLVICIQPAVIEEIAFRGVILDSLTTVLEAREAVIVSALLFMVIHVSIASFPHLFVMGLLLGFLRGRTGSLYPCMILHCTHNSLCVLEEVLGWG